MGNFAFHFRIVLGIFLCASLSFGLPIFSSDFNYVPSPPQIVSFLPGDTFGPWTVGTGPPGTNGIDRKSGDYWQAPPGSWFSVDLAGQAPGSIYTPIGVTSGNLYQVDFQLSGNPEWKVWTSYPGGPLKTVEVSAAGQVQTFNFDTTNTTTANMGWVPHSFFFVANNSTVSLRFADVTSILGGFGPVIAGVRVYDLGASADIPEPATMALMGGALLGLALIRRRRVTR
ncbi:MAG: DUF642 domain-containing protein [Bryobacteraceae bacterium]|nr:DUF642 domain-containing protein [Bryobacteraceae bacterium]